MCFFILSNNNGLHAQHAGTLPDTNDLKKKPAPDKINLLVYMRVISDTKGNKRADENFICNFKLLNWLYLEAGFRQGERPNVPDSYYHYKLELQTGYFKKTIRFFSRLSDNVINFPSPSYRKTNEMLVAEARYSFSEAWQVNGGFGYLFSSQQSYVPDALPTRQGVQVNSPVFKLAVKYSLKNKSAFELVYGSYDIFNPYALNQPFIQIAAEQELCRRCTLYAYLRYQYANQLYKPNNYFLGLGLRFHLKAS